MTAHGGHRAPASTPKDSLRALIRRDRAAESAAVRDDRAARLAGTARQLIQLAGPGVAAFLPTNGEPDIIPLLRRLPTPIFLPTVAGDFELDWVRGDPATLTVVARGIPRPAGPLAAHGAAVGELAGVVLVPALALDPRDGGRLGYGGGYYDRLLERLPPTVHTVGVCREGDLVPVPREQHDVSVGWLLTEAGLRRVPGPAPRKVEGSESEGDSAHG